MIIKENQALHRFLTGNKEQFSEIVWSLLNQLEKELTFKLKIQKASIQLVCNVPFAIIGFRRSLDYIFVEFYNDIMIDNPRIVSTIAKSKQLIIHRLYVSSLDDIDIQLLTWIKSSNLLVK